MVGGVDIRVAIFVGILGWGGAGVCQSGSGEG